MLLAEPAVMPLFVGLALPGFAAAAGITDCGLTQQRAGHLSELEIGVSPAVCARLSQCHLAYFDHAAVLTFSLVRTGLQSLTVGGASWRTPCWPGFLTA